MVFSKEDFNKIEAYLHHRVVKDTQFEYTDSVSSETKVPIIQDGKNKITGIYSFIQGLENSAIQIYDVNHQTGISDTYTLQSAREAVPDNIRNTGIIITFKTSTIYQVWQYNGGEWNNDSSWNNITAHVVYINNGIDSAFNTTITLSVEGIDSSTDALIIQHRSGSTVHYRILRKMLEDNYKIKYMYVDYDKYTYYYQLRLEYAIYSKRDSTITLYQNDVDIETSDLDNELIDNIFAE